MKKLFLLIATVLSLSCSLLFVGCSDQSGNTNDDQIRQVYNTYVVYAESNGETPLSYEDWLASIKGEKGDKGDKGETGANGNDGVTPIIEISNDGYWVINGEKTEYKAIGKDGVDGANGANGQDGKNGKDGATPIIEIIGGYWYINGENSGVKAEGKDGNN
ncbi:MAG: hypothetical protein IKA12_02400, partial [Clostridia bacterium]|nr:hypothetical protein [Clostridia bacterium]